MDDSRKTIRCEKCGRKITAAEDGEYPSTCPGCGQLLVIAGAEEPRREDRDDEIEAAAIRRIVVERRALLRTRGYYLVLTWACVALAAQMMWMMAHALTNGGWQNWLVIYPAAALFLLVMGRDLWMRARKLGEQVRKSALAEPSLPPDFKDLSDGSQKWNNLDQLG
jgi:hypothetical protein